MQPVTQNLRQAPPAPTPTPPPRFVSKRARTILVSTISGAVSLALAYGIGLAEGAAKSKALEQRAQQQQVGHEKSTDTLRAQLDNLKGRTQLLEARRALHQSLMALKLDNFGTAREHLAKVHTLIAQQKPVPGSPLSDLSDAIKGVELGVTADPLPLQLELTQLAADFDAMLDG